MSNYRPNVTSRLMALQIGDVRQIAPLFAVATILAVGSIGFLLATYRLGLAGDTAEMQYVSLQILHGLAPYRDVFEINWPMTYAFHIVEMLVFGKSDLGWRLFDYVILTTIVALLLSCFEKGKRAAAVIAASLFTIFHVLYSGHGGFGERDYVMLLPLSVFTWAYCRAMHRSTGRARAHLLIGGLFLGLAVFVKPTAILLFPIFALHRLVISPTVKERFQSVMFFLLGGAMAAAAILGWLAISGGLFAFLDIQLGFVLPIYSHYHRPITSLSGGRVLIFNGLIGIIATCICFLPGTRNDLHWRTAAFWRRPEIVFAAMFVFGVVSYLAQGKFYLYQWHPILLFGFFTVAFAFNLSWRRSIATYRVLGAAILIGAIAGTAGLFYTNRSILSSLFTFEREPFVGLLIRDLAALGVAADQPVQVLDESQGAIETLYWTDRRLPTRYVDGFQFLDHSSTYPYIAALRADFLAELTNAGYPLLVISNDLNQYVPIPTYDTLNRWPGFVAFLNTHYALAMQHDIEGSALSYRIYVARP